MGLIDYEGALADFGHFVNDTAFSPYIYVLIAKADTGLKKYELAIKILSENIDKQMI